MRIHLTSVHMTDDMSFVYQGIKWYLHINVTSKYTIKRKNHPNDEPIDRASFGPHPCRKQSEHANVLKANTDPSPRYDSCVAATTATRDWPARSRAWDPARNGHSGCCTPRSRKKPVLDVFLAMRNPDGAFGQCCVWIDRGRISLWPDIKKKPTRRPPFKFGCDVEVFLWENGHSSSTVPAGSWSRGDVLEPDCFVRKVRRPRDNSHHFTFVRQNVAFDSASDRNAGSKLTDKLTSEILQNVKSLIKLARLVFECFNGEFVWGGSNKASFLKCQCWGRFSICTVPSLSP